MSTRAFLVMISPLALITALPAFAQDSGDESVAAASIPTIIVTAQKRSQDWLDVPIALSVQSAEEIEAERSLNTYDMIRQVPGVTGANPSEELTQVSIRGVSSEDYGIGSDPTVGVFFDNVYLGRNENTATNFIDLERAEIARGPQGALFGRATPAGAISLVPVRPGPDFEYSLLGEAGTEAQARLGGVINLPLGETLFLRTSAVFDSQGDYVHNLTLDEELGGETAITGRISLRWEAGPATIVDLTGWAERFDGDPWLYRNFTETTDLGEDEPEPLSLIGEIYSDLSARDQEESRSNWGAFLRVEHELDSGITLSSTTSALGYDSDYLEDFDGSDLFLFNYGQMSEQSLVTQELRAVSGNGGPVTWFGGVLAYREDITSTIVQSYGDFDLCVFYEFDDAAGCAPAGSGVTDTFIFADGSSEGLVLYADVTVALSDRVDVTVGARYTSDTKRLTINAPVPGGFLPADDVAYTMPTDGLDVTREEDFTSVQPRVAVNFRPTDNITLYALYSEGEKPGGFDTFDAFSPSFNAEKIESFEAGLKGNLVNRRVNFSLTAYTNDYSDLQVLVADGPRDIVRNAASAMGQGIEFEGTARFGIAELGLRAALIDSTFGEFVDGADDFSGNRLPYTPDYTIGATLAIDAPVSDNWSIHGRIDADYQHDQFLTPGNDAFASQPGYERIDLRLGLRAESGLDLYLFGSNVTDAKYVAYGDATDYDTNFGAFLGQFSRPATYGIGFKISGPNP